MNIFRGYTDGLATSYQVATCQSGSFRRAPKTVAAPRGAKISFTKALANLTALVQKVLYRRDSSPVPSDFSRQLDLFAQPITRHVA